MKNPIVIFLVSFVSMLLAVGVSHVIDDRNTFVENVATALGFFALLGAVIFIGLGIYYTVKSIFK